MEPKAGSDLPPATPNSFSRPRPRPPRSPSETAKIRVQNRRREYLERNPRYFSSVEHEFADPDLYDTVIREFQTPAEREAEGRSRGYAKVLESSLMRGEARLERLASSYTGDHPPPPPTSTALARKAGRSTGDTNFIIDTDLADEKPATKEEGRAAWEEFLRERFVRGGDEDFDYSRVDENEEFDAMEERDREEEWFDEQEPEWADDSDDDGVGDDDEPLGSDGENGPVARRGKRERVLVGETGVQDY